MTGESDNLDVLISAAQVAAFYSVDEKTIDRWAKAGRIPRAVVNQPRFKRWSRNAIAAHVEQSKVRVNVAAPAFSVAVPISSAPRPYPNVPIGSGGWSPHFRCALTRHTPLRRSPVAPCTTPLAKTSRKRRAQSRARAECRREVMRRAGGRPIPPNQRGRE